MASEERLEQSYSLGQKLWWLILGRLITALILLLAGTLWVSSNAGQQAWRKMLSFLTIVVSLTFVYSLALGFRRALLFQARLQFTIDIFLITWLVWRSDVIHSTYTALY